MNNLPNANGWNNIKLKELVTIKGGKRLPKGKDLTLIKTKHPYIRITDLENNSIKKEQLRFITDDTFPGISKYIVSKNDVILSIVGTVGLVSIIDDDLDSANLTENCVKLTVLNKEILNYEYMFYYLISNNGQYEIGKNTVGAVQKKLPIYGIENINIRLPLIKEQKEITNILSSFDRKIKLLKEQNKTLETMAETIFFDFFNRSTNLIEVTLRELVNIKYGKDHKHLKNGVYPLYGSGGIMRYVGEYLYNKESILIPRKGTLGNLFFIQKPFWSVDTIFYTEIDDTKVFPIYLYYQLKRFNFANLNVGSAVPSLTTNVLNAVKLKIPNLDCQKEIVYILKSLNSKNLNNLLQIQTLEETRDLLLSKLMSGRMRVNND